MLTNSHQITQNLENTEKNNKCFGISNADMLNENKVKVIYGIAGSAKSSNIDNFFRSSGTPYARFTSTNKLKRDAFSRYGCYCDTIAGGLFVTTNGQFFSDFKTPPYKHIVIDEILQTDPRIFDWIESNRGCYNIIITTDEKQMLNADSGNTMLSKFRELCSKPYIIARELSYSYRARNEKTRHYFNLCYSFVDESFNRFKADSRWFHSISFSDLEYNHTDVFICHSNDIELDLFREFDLYHDYSADLLPKGAIARKEEFDAFKYPIIPQCQTPRTNIGYLQPVNVGSATRYQGSEVTDKQILYFLVGRDDFVGNREFYTVITRLWNIDNFCIVWCDRKKTVPLTVYNDKPVKETGWYSLSGDIKLSDGRNLSDIAHETSSREIVLTDIDMQKLLEKIPLTGDVYYNRNAIIYGDKIIKRAYTDDDSAPVPHNAPTMLGYLQKEPDFNYDYMPDFYRAFESVQRSRWNNAPMSTDILIPPCIVQQERSSATPFPDSSEYENLRPRESFRYQLDFFSSYPNILYNEKLPTGNSFTPRLVTCTDDEFHTAINTNQIDWYISYSDLLPEGCVCTGALARFIQAHTTAWSEFWYIGTSSCKRGSAMGQKLHEMAYRTKESKSLIKHVHYGLAERPYLERIEFDDQGNNKAYAVNQKQNHQLLMLAIRSYQCLNILKLKWELYSDLRKGAVNADALYFDSDLQASKLLPRLSRVVPGYDFRILSNNAKRPRILCKTYSDLPTAAELKKQNRKKT